MSKSTETRAARLTVKERVVAVLRRLDESCRECRRRGMSGTRCLDCDLDGIGRTLEDAQRCGRADWCGDEAAPVEYGLCGEARRRGKPLEANMAKACEAVLAQLGVWGEMESIEIAEVVRGVDAGLVPFEVIRRLSKTKKMARCFGSKTKYGRGARYLQLDAAGAASR